ncbi:MAG: two pore domain potassium channel family protein [Chitinophagales bacterium]|nr:two pore domain potassium channel family protein [Chitinophagales bacterium]
MPNALIHRNLNTYRYEFLLIALLLLIFDKIFVPDPDLYIRYVWLANMLIIAMASYGIFSEHNRTIQFLRNLMGIISVSMPFLFLWFQTNEIFLLFLSIFFATYYSFIFSIVLYQITLTKEVRINVVIGSFCGYLLLSMVALFSYLLIEILYPKSFHGIEYGNVPAVYNQLSYFSFITLTSIGFGDIYPITDMSRLTVAFFGMLGQFYMVAVVGIIISKFTSNN